MKNGWGVEGWRVKTEGVGLRVKSNYIKVGVSDFSLQKFNLSIFVTEGLLNNFMSLGQTRLGEKKSLPQNVP